MAISKLSTSASLKQVMDKFEEISIQDFSRSNVDIITAKTLPSVVKEGQIVIITQNTPDKIYVSLNSEKFIHYESQTIGKSLTYYKKMRQMYISKMYYHKTYNKINSAQVLVYKILNICRKIELLIEIPIRKILRK